jgi:hypothetical protein
MKRVILYDTRSGQIQAIGDVNSMTRRMDLHFDIVQSLPGANDETHYVSAGMVLPREKWTYAIINYKDILADGVDAITISNLPDPCWLLIDNVPTEVIGGTHVFMRSQLGMIRVEMIGRYICDPWIITAHDLTTLKTKAKARIDAAAEVARQEHLTAGAGQSLVYAMKLKEAEKVRRIGRPVLSSDSPLLAAEASAKGISVETLADQVIAADQRWTEAATSIEVKRLAAKKAVDDAADVRAVLAAEQINWSDEV